MPMVGAVYRRRDPLERLRKKSRAAGNGCLEYTGCKDGLGYGHFWMNDRLWLAHRAAWELEECPIPDGMLVCHRCDNPSCIAVAHLFLGSDADNSRDMVTKGRGRVLRGRDNPRAKLTEHQVRSIRRADAHGMMRVTLAHKYGVSDAQITRICRGESWPHV
jgi:hypothetical protein